MSNYIVEMVVPIEVLESARYFPAAPFKQSARTNASFNELGTHSLSKGKMKMERTNGKVEAKITTSTPRSPPRRTDGIDLIIESSVNVY